jgi:hypothetical protein
MGKTKILDNDYTTTLHLVMFMNGPNTSFKMTLTSRHLQDIVYLKKIWTVVIEKIRGSAVFFIRKQIALTFIYRFYLYLSIDRFIINNKQQQEKGV